MNYKKITIRSYDKTVKDYTKNVRNLHPKREATAFLSLLKRNSLILDLGCGPGRDAKIFSDKGLKVVGVDLSKNMILAAKKNAPRARFKVMDLTDLKLRDKSFDGIWAHMSFLHLSKKDLLMALKEAYRVLKRGGILYLSVKQGSGQKFLPDSRYKENIKKFWVFYQKDEIEQMLVKSGFRIMQSYVKTPKDSYSNAPKIFIFCQKEK
ncbi:class I SAM-dependent methyltransferase [Candidatus Woesearchaeota archaeon]|nr:class I SAM-dependent methyltransferase [Candidatus Woesearchaeota archaeon]